LIKDGLIIRKPVVIHSRWRVRRNAIARRKGRHTGPGKRKGTANARMPTKVMTVWWSVLSVLHYVQFLIITKYIGILLWVCNCILIRINNTIQLSSIYTFIWPLLQNYDIHKRLKISGVVDEKAKSIEAFA